MFPPYEIPDREVELGEDFSGVALCSPLVPFNFVTKLESASATCMLCGIVTID